jgi:hypothetical protein
MEKIIRRASIHAAFIETMGDDKLIAALWPVLVAHYLRLNVHLLRKGEKPPPGGTLWTGGKYPPDRIEAPSVQKDKREATPQRSNRTHKSPQLRVIKGGI